MSLLTSSALKREPRLLIEMELVPLQGDRFQPTGFPNLGAATYQRPDGTQMLLVESAQSMANRLEMVCWDEGAGKPIAALDGMPYVEAVLPDGTRTDSLREAHRLNSPYIVNSSEFSEITDAVGFQKDKPFDRRKLARALLRYDPNSLIHGIFLEKIGGVVRLPRLLSGFIEARGVREAVSGGVKFDRVQPETTTSTPYGKADEGFGNVPFARDEYTAERIDAFFNIDLALLRGLGLFEPAEDMLLTLCLFKIRRFVDVGLRLRTACDLMVRNGITIRKPQGESFPETDDVEAAVREKLAACSMHFNSPSKLTVNFQKKTKV